MPGVTPAHAPQFAPSFAHFPDEAQNRDLIYRNRMKYTGSTPDLYDRGKRAPADLARNCGSALRYDPQDGWVCGTAPCNGPKPHDGALCDIQTGEWVTPTVGGRARTWGGRQSLVQMAPCAIDRNHFYQVGTLGNPVCDRLTGRYYYDNTEGRPGEYDGQTLSAANTWRRDASGASKRGRGGLASGHGITSFVQGNAQNRYRGAGVLMDRAYTGDRGAGVPFVTTEGQLHPALTNMGSFRTRGWHQKNSQIRPTLRIPARPDPAALQPRGGTMVTPRRPDRFGRVTPRPVAFTPSDLAASASIYQRPAPLTPQGLVAAAGTQVLATRGLGS